MYSTLKTSTLKQLEHAVYTRSTFKLWFVDAPFFGWSNIMQFLHCYGNYIFLFCWPKVIFCQILPQFLQNCSEARLLLVRQDL